MTREEIREILNESPFRFMFEDAEIERIVEEVYNRYVIGYPVSERKIHANQKYAFIKEGFYEI